MPGPRSLRQVKSYLAAEEKQEVAALAKRAGVSISELVRRLVLGRVLPAPEKHRDTLELVKINADLARLGNLLRMALETKEFKPPPGFSLGSLFANIRATQDLLKSKIERL